MVALWVLGIICMLAVLAPVLSPQDPYDLSVIDVREGRKPPGSVRMSKIRSIAIEAAAESLQGERVVLTVVPARAGDTQLTEGVALELTRTSPGADDWQLLFRLDERSALSPLKSVSIDGLPRSARLSAGEKVRFRNRWVLTGDDVGGLVVSFKAPPARLRLRVGMDGGSQRPLMTYWLGTDDQGRDMLSAILYGLRISLGVALSSVIVAVSIGIMVGLYAAFVGGRFDTLVMRLVDLQLSFPTILVALILLAVLGKGIGNVVMALIIVQWAFYARTARGIALAERRKEYVEAATSLSLGRFRIIVRHILPNCMPSLIVVATLQVGAAITLEATLSFLGLGLPVTQPSLGLLISNGFEYLLSGYPWISIMPGLALLVTVVSINLVGDELRDVLNPRLRR